MTDEKTEALAKPEPADEKAKQLLDLMNMDVSSLGKADQARYLAAMAQSRGLNPLLKPFDLIPGRNNKLIIYANSGCADQIAEGRKLSRILVYAGPLCVLYTDDNGRLVADRTTVLDKDQYVTVWKVEEHLGEGHVRVTYDVGANYAKEAEGDGKTNLILRTFTKGDRRAVLGHGGIGLPDATELDTIPILKLETGPKTVAPPQPQAAAAVVPAEVIPPPPSSQPQRAAAPPPVPRKPPAPPVPPKR